MSTFFRKSSKHLYQYHDFATIKFQFWDCSTSYSSKMLFVTLQHQEIKESVTPVLNVQTWEVVLLEYALKDLECVANVHV